MFARTLSPSFLVLLSRVRHFTNPPALVFELMPYSPRAPPPNEMSSLKMANPLLLVIYPSLDLIRSLSLPVLMALIKNPSAEGPLPTTIVSTVITFCVVSFDYNCFWALISRSTNSCFFLAVSFSLRGLVFLYFLI